MSDNQCIEFKVKTRIGTYQINKISLSGFHDKIYIKNNRYDGLPLGYQGYLENTIILTTT